MHLKKKETRSLQIIDDDILKENLLNLREGTYP